MSKTGIAADVADHAMRRIRQAAAAAADGEVSSDVQARNIQRDDA